MLLCVNYICIPSAALLWHFSSIENVSMQLHAKGKSYGLTCSDCSFRALFHPDATAIFMEEINASPEVHDGTNADKAPSKCREPEKCQVSRAIWWNEAAASAPSQNPSASLHGHLCCHQLGPMFHIPSILSEVVSLGLAWPGKRYDAVKEELRILGLIDAWSFR